MAAGLIALSTAVVTAGFRWLSTAERPDGQPPGGEVIDGADPA